MIHLHHSLATLADPFAAGTTKPAEAHIAADSFRSALSDAASSTPQPFGGDPNQGQVTGTPSTGTTSGSTAGSSNPSGNTSTAEPYDPFAQAANTPWMGVPVPSASNSSSATSGNNAPNTTADPTLAFDNAYWAQQPAAVQSLRTMQDPQQRAAYASQLASQGYTIDVPIMVWGWDPSVVTSMRQADGYTWVPSALQNPVQVAPGLGAVGNLAAYNPNNPPAGSIAVS